MRELKDGVYFATFGGDMYFAHVRDGKARMHEGAYHGSFECSINDAALHIIEPAAPDDWSADLSGCEKGDLVGTVFWGWVEVTNVVQSRGPDVQIETPEGEYKWINYRGCFGPDDAAPSVFTRPPRWLLEIIGEKPEAKPKTAVQEILDEVYKIATNERLSYETSIVQIIKLTKTQTVK